MPKDFSWAKITSAMCEIELYTQFYRIKGGGGSGRKLLIKSRNQNIFQIFKMNPVKFPFQRYIICWGKIYGSKSIGGGGGGGGASHLRLLFCKIV